MVRLYRLLDLSDPGVQVGYYDPGVGTFASGAAWTPAARWVSRTAGLAFGAGMRQNLGEAYTWLMQHWAVGDRVFVFGFSRGAYTARALLGMIRQIGLLRPGLENLVPYAVAEYASRSGQFTDADWDEVHEFADTFAQKVDDRTSVPVAYVELWDTVKAAGFLNWDVHWAWTRKIPYNVAAVRHAVSIDETRRPYREYLLEFERPEATAAREAWFAGVHSDVGGTFEDAPGLSTIALRWVVAGALDSQLRIRTRRWPPPPTPWTRPRLSLRCITPMECGGWWGRGPGRSRPGRRCTPRCGIGWPRCRTIGRRCRRTWCGRTTAGPADACLGTVLAHRRVRERMPATATAPATVSGWRRVRGV